MWLVSFLVLSLAGIPAIATSPIDFAAPIWRANPAVRADDAYKWLFQATRGGEHAIDREGALSWLQDEWKTLTPPRAGEREWEPLTADGAIGRLNLRPYRARGGDPVALAEAFARAASSFAEDPAAFRAAWEELGERVRTAPIGAITQADWARVDAEARRSNYDARHHSAAYEAAERPAYRVLTRAEAVRLGAVR